MKRIISSESLKIPASDKGDGVFEDGEPLSFFGQIFARPARVIGAVQKRFGMRHESEEPSRLIADAGNGTD